MIYHDGAKEKFATQVTSQILAEVRALAHREGQQLQATAEQTYSFIADLYPTTGGYRARTR